MTLEERYQGFTVYDNRGRKISKVDGLFLDEQGRAEYVGVKIGFFLGRKRALIPMDIARVDEHNESIEISQPWERVRGAPTYANDEREITPEYERRVRAYYGLGGREGSRGERRA